MPSDPTPSVYDQLGGADGLRALVDRFYALMDTLETAQTIRAMHPPDLTGSADKLFDFLSGWTGGPPLFVQKHGTPCSGRGTCPTPSTRRQRGSGWCA